MTPFFSVIIPLYNKESYISETIESVLNQSFNDFEIIIVNDGSTDLSQSKVELIDDSKIRLHSIKNSGVSFARNFGVSKAQGQLLAFLDADDIWLPNHLQDLKYLFDSYPNCGLYAKAYASRKHNQDIISYYNGIPNSSLWDGVLDDYFKSSLYNSIAHTSAVAIPKKTFLKLGGFNENYNSGEDIDLWIRLALNYKVAFSNKVSSIYRLTNEQSITSTSLVNRHFMDLDAFNSEAKTNPSLHKYLDLNRLSLAYQYKLEGHSKKSKQYLQAINNENISGLQKHLLRLPTPLLKLLLNSRNYLRKRQIDLRLFKR